MEEELLATLAQDPSDDDARAVLADWLEEEGRANDAELVRVFLARKSMHAGAAGVVACSQRLRTLAVASTWSGGGLVLCDPTLRASAHRFIDPPWTQFDPLRLGPVPSGLGTPDMFVCVESDAGPVLRIDVYRAYGSCDATAWSGRAFIGYDRRVACVEPYSRAVAVIELDSELGSFHHAPGLLLAVTAERVVRLDPDGGMRWQSEPVGGGGVQIQSVSDDGVATGVGLWEDWETGALADPRAFRLDLASGLLLM